MLRKTKHNRASMKRSGSNEMPGDFAPDPRASNESNNNRSNNVIYQKHNRPDDTMSSVPQRSRPQSRLSFKGIDENENAMASMATPIPNERKMSLPKWMDKNDSLDNIGIYVQEEIHPGVILEGYAVEI